MSTIEGGELQGQDTPGELASATGAENHCKPCGTLGFHGEMLLLKMGRVVYTTDNDSVNGRKGWASVPVTKGIRLVPEENVATMS